jgi:hypothetical protein
MASMSSACPPLLLGLALLASCTTARRELELEALPLADVPAAHGTPSPSPLPSPVDPGAALVERDHRIWLRDRSGRLRQLTADTTGEHRFAELFARQREGEVILYWATVPMWSPDGRLVAYVTNRGSVLAGTPGQAVWVVDPATGVERPLLSTPGKSYRHAGWLGEELLFFGDAAPGVWAVDPGSAAQRFVSDGYVSATTGDGSAVAITRGDTVVVLSRGVETDLPAPPPGFRYASDAEFSPDGQRLAIALSDGRGGSQVRVFEMSSRRSATLAYPDSLSATHRPTWRDADHLQLIVQVRHPRHPDERRRRGPEQALVVKVRG